MNLVSFLHSFIENISDLTECNVLFNYEHLILIWYFLLIDTEFDLRILNPEIIKYITENPQDVVIFKIVFSIHIVFQYQSKIICVIELKKKRINFLFIAV